jgi:hypothetical protein
MKKSLIILSVLALLALPAKAADDEAKPGEGEVRKRPALTAEQKALRKELVEKYDTNKNNRLDKEERSKMTPEDQKKWESVSPAPRGKPADKPAAPEKKKEK